MLLKNNKAFTLTELIAGIVLSTLVALIFSTLLLFFFRTYSEITEYNKLQDDTFLVLQTIRNGLTKENFNRGKPLIGLTTAKTVEITGLGSSVTIRPPASAGARYIKYSVDSQKRLIATSQDNTSYVNSVVLFPNTNEKYKRKYKYTVESLNFRNVTTGTTKVKLVEVTIKTQVRFREKAKSQNVAQDKEENLRTIEFKQVIYVANADLK